MNMLVLAPLLAIMIPVGVGRSPARHMKRSPPDAAAMHCDDGSGSGSSSRCGGGDDDPLPAIDDSGTCDGDDGDDDDDDDSCDSDSSDDSSCDSGDAGDSSCDSGGGGDDCNAADRPDRHGHHPLATGLAWASLPVPFAVVLRRRARKRAAR